MTRTPADAGPTAVSYVQTHFVVIPQFQIELLEWASCPQAEPPWCSDPRGHYNNPSFPFQCSGKVSAETLEVPLLSR